MKLKHLVSPPSLFPHARRCLATIALFAASATFAGTPLICHPYEIGQAKSLPGGTYGHGVSATYDRATLVPDTLAVLTPGCPILVRMETLRRAAIYATGNMRGWDKGTYTAEDRTVAGALLEKLRERTKTSASAGKDLALFDLGFFAETLRQTGMDPGIDGYALLKQVAELRSGDPEVEFALALATSWPKRPEQAKHLANARAAAKANAQLAANLASHF